VAGSNGKLNAETYVAVSYPALNTEVRRAAPILAIVRASATNAIRPLTGAAVLQLVRPDKGVVAAMTCVSHTIRGVNTEV
jgi:hypothetical protein